MSNLVHSTAFGLARQQGAVRYPSLSAAPYAPDTSFPEFPELPLGAESNPVFTLVRESLRQLGLDAEHESTPEWNPLGDLVKPGGKIVVKPNWVFHQNDGSGGMDCMISHPSVLRAVLEYAFLAQPSQVVLGDAPIQGCDFEHLLDFGGLRSVIADFQNRGLPLTVQDFRRTVMCEEGDLRQVTEELRPESDYCLVDLGAGSLLEPISKDWRRFRVSLYDSRKMWPHHRPGRHRFLVARDILEADLVVNVPKLKSHKKAGITCCLKNLIGINGNKEYLPHHRKGAADAGTGDNYAHRYWQMDWAEALLDRADRMIGFPRIHRLCERVVWWLMHFPAKSDTSVQIDGSWHGNDTIWRTCLDLNRVLLYAGTDGRMHNTLQRDEISIVDAVVAGQGEGPLAPDPLETGAVFSVRNPAVGDFLGAQLLGFDAAKIPLLQHVCDDMRWRLCVAPPVFPSFDPPFLPARAPKGWAGHVEHTQ
jgi:uncharacterized protein (DUF362 family)